MKKLALSILIVFQCLSLGAQEKIGVPKPQEGVGNHGYNEGVGNHVFGEGVGNIVSKPMFLLASAQYSSPYIQYPEKLKMQRVSEVETTIDNSNLVQSNEPVSGISFELLNKKNLAYAAIDNLDKLKGILPDPTKRNWQPVGFPGAKGFSSETTSPHLVAEYFVLTNNKDVIHITLNAFLAAEGMGLVAPIIHTFTYDITPPVVQEIKSGPTFKAGQAAFIRFRITDDLSGVYLGFQRMWANFLRFDRVDGQKGFATQGNFRSLGGDWYETSFQIPPYLSPGEYILTTFNVKDKADNAAFFSLFDGKNFREAILREDPSKSDYGKDSNHLAVFRVTITSDQKFEDKSLVIREMKFGSKTLKAGETSELLVKVENGSINYMEALCGTRTVVTPMSPSPSDVHMESGGSAIEVSKGWYRIPVAVSCLAKPGDYYLRELELCDDAGNVLRLDPDSNGVNYTGNGNIALPIARIQVTPCDVQAKVSQYIDKFNISPELKVGETGKIRIHFVTSKPVRGIVTGSVSFRPPFNSVNSHFSANFRAKPLGGGWYSGVFKVGDYLPGGEYLLEAVGLNAIYHSPEGRIESQSGWLNVVDDSRPFYNVFGFDRPEFSTNVPVVKVQVTR